MLGRFLDFARKVSGGRFRRQQYHVGDGSSPVRICCKHRCCRLFITLVRQHSAYFRKKTVAELDGLALRRALLNVADNHVAHNRDDPPALFEVNELKDVECRHWRRFAKVHLEIDPSLGGIAETCDALL
jgi:hypothetical protein